MWFTQTTANLITHFDYASHKQTNYAVPTPLSSPVGIIVTPDSAIWFCEFLGQKIGRLNATTGEIKEYPVPPTLLGPAVMRALTDDRYIWFTAIVGNAIGRVDIATGEIKAYSNPALLNLPIEDTNDGNGNICALAPPFFFGSVWIGLVHVWLTRSKCRVFDVDAKHTELSDSEDGQVHSHCTERYSDRCAGFNSAGSRHCHALA